MSTRIQKGCQEILRFLATAAALGAFAAAIGSGVGHAQQESTDGREVVQPGRVTRPRVQGDPMRAIQTQAMQQQRSPICHWGNHPHSYSNWINHSNRLVPVYTFGITLDAWRGEGSVYGDADRLRQLYGRVPENTLNPTANYYDQTDICSLQRAAVDAGYSNIILIVLDGMDWQTAHAASLYKGRSNDDQSGRGRGLAFQDERRVETDFAFVVTSPLLSGAKVDVNWQTVASGGREATGGYDPARGGEFPWHEQSAGDYLMGLDRESPHTVTDSAAAGTSLTSGIKTYNDAINVRSDGTQVVPIARSLQADEDFKVGIVTNVPISHATPGAAYANNVSRFDHQDIARDLLGLPSIAHRRQPLPGVDVLIGCGWGEQFEADSFQGDNYRSGNVYLHEEDLQRVDVKQGGQYVVVQRTTGKRGRSRLMAAAQRAADEDNRLLGFFGATAGHLPYPTADGRYNPTFDMRLPERYTQADLDENPTLAEMTRAALLVLEQSIDGFWLMIEVGDVDWANHANNIDNSIGAVLSGEAAFEVVMDWIDENNAWDYTAVIVTADHGHHLVIDDAAGIAAAGQRARQLPSSR